MTSPPEDRANQTSPSGQSSSPGQTPPSGQSPSPEQIPPQVEDEQIKDIVEDNEERLWYITKFGEGKFDGDELENLIEVRSRFRENPNYQLSATDEVGYRKATMAAAAFLEDRHPEAIRLFAEVQRKESPNPLTKWLWMIAVALFLALSSNGYQTLISNQIKRMKETRSMYIQEATLLTQPDNNLAIRLSSMCEQTLVYRAAASQLLVLLPIFTSERPGSGNGSSGSERPGVCKVIEEEKIKQVPNIGKMEGADAQMKFLEANGQIIENARKAEFAAKEDRAVRLTAELYDSILALFVMPMLYALLGALTSAVRTASNEFKSMTLKRVDGSSRGARVLLGVVGGATIGIVFSADTLDGTAGLTVLGLAFAVGYAVDLFFNLLDGIKMGLGGSRQAAPQNRGASTV